MPTVGNPEQARVCAIHLDIFFSSQHVYNVSVVETVPAHRIINLLWTYT